MIRRPPRSTLLPYTTLFRALIWPSPNGIGLLDEVAWQRTAELALTTKNQDGQTVLTKRPDKSAYTNEYVQKALRSEEHTSELQSRQYLVCRLLLERNKHSTDSFPICLFNDPSTTEIYTLALHDALPSSDLPFAERQRPARRGRLAAHRRAGPDHEEPGRADRAHQAAGQVRLHQRVRPEGPQIGRAHV